ncbi:4-(cytidine 5'-diphospho)-2-C-methyl-D-erythritol kinase [Rariglobus hedericola]|uniref:4-diphosphocytidyl-2-C-methyl-D-erythritol kinase n=1 Tax=Rariglobus hedericola TaxID=2597822 RepID=A0A556QQ25_9BACT|nr:4-(cytidine 5'-diphospho)-2-C-methyl-D-erythritol kinase [Rariglobus hedericola]TSJ78731.1 4-(cytidine 5'-diphospho)-2-C-methyl-D-erythritol kinase [Rariglobus hedericola]
MTLVLSSPAKLNLFLAITGRRADGFHDLVSVAAPLEFGDTLTVELRPAGFSLECDDPALEIDGTNLVLRAAQAFAEAASWTGGAHFSLQKRIPMGAGLGGGSSNASTALLALNQLAGGVLTMEELGTVAATLGSDCPLFLQDGPVIMRGRGESLRVPPPQAIDRLRGRRVLVFKPAFGISTVWAYRQLAAGAPASYLPSVAAETQLMTWMDDATAPAEELLFNNMEVPAFTKHIALPVALECLREEFDLAPRMSGSGSACFAFLPENAPVAAITARIRELWGAEAFVTETRLA